MLESLSVDAIALLPRGKPYAAHFVAGLLAYEREAVEFEWPEVPEALARLGLACAMRGFDWGMHMHGEEYGFVLHLEKQRQGRRCVISQSAKYAAHYVVEPEGPCPVRQVWDDDDAHRDFGDLERFCQGLLNDWFAQLEPDVDQEFIETPILGDGELDTLLRFLRQVTDRRAALAAELASQVAQLEGQIAEAEDGSPESDELYARWSELGDRHAVAESPPPWPTYALTLTPDA